MTRPTTRIAALGAGALFSLGILSAAPAGASDGAQADATVSADAADAINQTLGLVNQACQDAASVSGAAASVSGAATSTLTSTHGITVAASPAGSTLGLNVSLPALGSVLGSVGGEVEAAAAQPLQVSCATSADGTGLGLSAAGVDALVNAIVPGVDVSSLGIDLPALGLSGSASTAAADPGTTQVSAAAASSVPTKARVNASSPTVRASASAPSATATSAVSAAPASASGGIVAQTVGSPGALARTGAGVGALGLLGSALFGSGRLLGFGRKLLKIG
jgi:hypothetical protein